MLYTTISSVMPVKDNPPSLHTFSPYHSYLATIFTFLSTGRPDPTNNTSHPPTDQPTTHPILISLTHIYQGNLEWLTYGLFKFNYFPHLIPQSPAAGLQRSLTINRITSCETNPIQTPSPSSQLPGTQWGCPLNTINGFNSQHI